MRKLMMAAALGALVLAACGGGKSSPGASSNNTTGKIASSNTTVSGGGSDFASLMAKTSAAKYKITYQSSGGTSFTIAQDPPKFRFSSGGSSSYVTADGSAVSCNGTGASATCTSLPGGGAIKQGLTGAFGALGALLVNQAGKGIPGLTNISKTSNEKIAGRDAVCATIDANSLGALGAVLAAAIGKGSYSVCVDKATGAMLSTKTDDGNGNASSVTATEFGTPSNSDFTPPATPITIPGISIPNTPST